LRRLARYGDRVSVVVDARLQTMVSIDSSIFRFVPAGVRAEMEGQWNP
jgi:hypothetical protein